MPATNFTNGITVVNAGWLDKHFGPAGHVHDGIDQDGSAPKVDFYDHVDVGSNGLLTLETNTAAEHRIKHAHAGGGFSVHEVDYVQAYNVPVWNGFFTQVNNTSSIATCELTNTGHNATGGTGAFQRVFELDLTSLPATPVGVNARWALQVNARWASPGFGPIDTFADFAVPNDGDTPRIIIEIRDGSGVDISARPLFVHVTAYWKP